jgi:hypothetical protein
VLRFSSTVPIFTRLKALGFDIDYKRLLGFFRKRSRLVRAIITRRCSRMPNIRRSSR